MIDVNVFQKVFQFSLFEIRIISNSSNYFKKFDFQFSLFEIQDYPLFPGRGLNTTFNSLYLRFVSAPLLRQMKLDFQFSLFEILPISSSVSSGRVIFQFSLFEIPLTPLTYIRMISFSFNSLYLRFNALPIHAIAKRYAFNSLYLRFVVLRGVV